MADRWTAGNQGPMGRVIDRQIYATTSPLRPVIGAQNQHFLADWLTGNLPATIEYDPSSIQVQNMMRSRNVGQARDLFYAWNAVGVPEFAQETFPAYWETIANPMTAKWHSTAMQVGGYRGASITNNRDGTMTFKIRNVAEANSFFFHVLPNLPNKTGPMHNVEQIIKWNERIDRNRLPRN